MGFNLVYIVVVVYVYVFGRIIMLIYILFLLTKKFLVVVIIASPVTKDVNYYMNFKTVVSVYLYDIMAIFSFPMLVTFCINSSSYYYIVVKKNWCNV